MDPELTGSFIDGELEHVAGRELREVIKQLKPQTELSVDVPFFHFFLAMVRHLVDPAYPKPRPTPVMVVMLAAQPVSGLEIKNDFLLPAKALLASTPACSDILTPEVLARAEEAARDPSILSWERAERLQ